MGPKNATKSAPKPLAPAVKPDNRHLATKETQLFKQLLQQYETKQWKKGIKTADAILKTRPDHGGEGGSVQPPGGNRRNSRLTTRTTETLAMKGLFFACQERKPEGYELIKRGVRNDMGSHIVWHVYGIMHRADKNFEEALKCYSQANRIEKVRRRLALTPSQLT